MTAQATSLATDVQHFLVRELGAFVREIELFPDDESVWRTLPGVTNAAGTLALHVSGNLQHFVGAVLGGTGYVRDRDLEFSRRGVSRAELVRELRATIAVVERVLPTVSEETLAGDYPEKVYGWTFGAREYLMHLMVHLAHHLGQAGYLRRVAMADARSSVPIALKELDAF